MSIRRSTCVAVPSVPLASWIEQFGRVVVEAQASGVPVVASASGALPDVVGRSGLLVPPNDPVALHVGPEPVPRRARSVGPAAPVRAGGGGALLVEEHRRRPDGALPVGHLGAVRGTGGPLTAPMPPGRSAPAVLLDDLGVEVLEAVEVLLEREHPPLPVAEIRPDPPS